MSDEWLPIETAPKDGRWLLAFGRGYRELKERGMWFTHNTDEPPEPMVWLIKWIEGWYDKEVDNGDGTYHKVRTLSYAYWYPEPHAFVPTHWMPLPDPPKE